MSDNPPLRDWHGRVVWIIGASSGIGRATALALAQAGAQVVISARHPEALQAVVAEARARQHPKPHPDSITALPLDVSEPATIHAALQRLRALHPQLDGVLYCTGHYRPVQATAFDLAQMLQHQSINYVGALHVLDSVLPLLRAQGHGHISLVSSVAGWRGLPKALAYGPTKAALSHLAQILHLELAPLGLGVSVIHPGFVATPLTAHNDFHMPALCSPEQAAQAILQGLAKGRFDIHFPRRFTWALKAVTILGLLNHRLCQALLRRITRESPP